jgi:cytoskeletal protein CcmA (bactofilin family)
MWKKETAKASDETRSSEMDKKEEEIVAFVGKGVDFKGTISYDGTVRIDGSLDGEINTTGMLVVGETASISAKITAGTIVSRGRITGDIVAKQRIQLLSPAILDGSVQTPVFSIEDGVTFNGTCEMGADVHQLPRDAGGRPTSLTATVKRATA